MIARSAASVVIAAGLVLGASGCSFFAPQASLIHYEPSDGVAASIGAIKARNVLAISEDGTSANLVFGLANDSGTAELVDFQYTDAAGAKQTLTVYAAANTVTPVGYDGGKSLELANIDTKVGGLFPVYMQYGSGAGKGLAVPVLDGSQEQFSTLAPTLVATPAP
ncbi:hypothetical protein BH11ACT2_BH11ACT2_17420 [soil metagenome]